MMLFMGSVVRPLIGIVVLLLVAGAITLVIVMAKRKNKPGLQPLQGRPQQWGQQYPQQPQQQWGQTSQPPQQRYPTQQPYPPQQGYGQPPQR